MPIEKVPYPQYLSYVPQGGRPHNVGNETWESIAADNRLDVKDLIDFNFKTTNPDEVNWYLHWKVGCKAKSANRRNWAFSPEAHPGIIYIPSPEWVAFRHPVENYHSPFAPDSNNLRDCFDDNEFCQGRKNNLARYLDDHDPDDSSSIEEIHFVLDVYEFVHLGVAVWGLGELSVGVLGMELLAPLLAEAAIFLSMAGGYAETIQSLKRKQYLDGLSEGILLGAHRATAHYVKSNFWVKYPVDTPYLPEQGKNLQDAHNVGLASGYAYGQQLSKRESRTLFRELNARMRIRQNPEIQYGKDYWSKWDDHARKLYYIDAAIVFRSVHLPR